MVLDWSLLDIFNDHFLSAAEINLARPLFVLHIGGRFAETDEYITTISALYITS